MSKLAAVVCDKADCIVRGAILGSEGLIEKWQLVVAEDRVQMLAG